MAAEVMDMPSELSKKETRAGDGSHRIDRFFDDWFSGFSFPRMLPIREWPVPEIRVDEMVDGGELVIRAELPGVDPDKDVELTVHDGALDIRAERREEKETEEKGYLRRELRFGSFSRSLPLPQGVAEEDIKATYKNGILEVRVPHREPQEAKKIAVTKA